MEHKLDLDYHIFGGNLISKDNFEILTGNIDLLMLEKSISNNY